jgi:hypothetical protein
VATVGVAFSLSPTVTGTVTSYSVAVALPTGLTLNATTGVISGTPNTATAQATYTITAANSTGSTPFALSLTVAPPAPPAPTLYPSTGTYPAYDISPFPNFPTNFAIEQAITFTDTTPGVDFYYTLDGSTPTTASTKVSGTAPVILTASATVNVIAVAGGLSSSPVASAVYTLAAPTAPSVNFPSLSQSMPSIPGISFLYTNGNTSAFTLSAGVSASCAYYQAIGAVSATSNCALTTTDGSFIGGLTMSQWMQSGPINQNGVTQASASFVNLMDLNFTRLHHGATSPTTGYGGGPATAGYVCNYPGPDFYAAVQLGGTGNSVNQPVIDSVLLNAMGSLNEVACVAMDYGLTYNTNYPGATGLSGGNPYVRFLVFNAAGNLIPSVDLDGLHANEPVPNACVSCHGGSTSSPYTGAHFLPFDEANFAFSSIPGQTQADQEAQIKQLNLLVLNGTGTDITPQVVDLINGWYGNNLAASTQNTTFVPSGLLGSGGAATEDSIVYLRVFAPLCRTCHVANNFPLTVASPGDMLGYFSLGSSVNVCDPSTETPNPLQISSGTVNGFLMPNSKVTFDRFWTSHIGANLGLFTATAAPIDLPGLVSNYFGPSSGCGSFLFSQ